MSQRTIARGLVANLDAGMRSGIVQEIADDGIEVVGREQSEAGIVVTASTTTPDVIVMRNELRGRRQRTEE